MEMVQHFVSHFIFLSPLPPLCVPSLRSVIRQLLGARVARKVCHLDEIGLVVGANGHHSSPGAFHFREKENIGKSAKRSDKRAATRNGVNALRRSQMMRDATNADPG